jgi:eukaryotic-like serine/threonine-protein kinase
MSGLIFSGAVQNRRSRYFFIAALLFVVTLPAFSSPLSQTGKTGQISLSEPLTVRWQYSSDLTVNLTPAVAGERVYLPLATGTIVSLRSTDGQMFWKTEIGGEVSASPGADERAVYIASETLFPPSKEVRATGALRALGREGGVTLWMRTFHRPLRGSLAVDDTTIFGGTADGRVFAVDKGTGRFLWVAQHWQPFNSHPSLFGSTL